MVTGGPQPCSAAVSGARTHMAYTADQLASAYRFSSLYGAGDKGAGQTIALFELEPDNASDIAAYQSCYGTSATGDQRAGRRRRRQRSRPGARRRSTSRT